VIQWHLQKRHLFREIDVEELNIFLRMCSRKYSVRYDQGVKNLAGCMGQ